MKIPSFEVNLKTVGIILIIGAIVFLGVKHIQLSKTVKILGTTQQFIGKALIDKGIIKVQQPQVKPQVQMQKAPKTVKEEEAKGK